MQGQTSIEQLVCWVYVFWTFSDFAHIDLHDSLLSLFVVSFSKLPSGYVFPNIVIYIE
jgi:hypothetical protein